jgi:hypothetical protein
MHSDDEHSASSPPNKILFTAGIRQNDGKVPDTSRSSIRPLTNKSISFAPGTEEGAESVNMEDEPHQEVPSGSHSSAVHSSAATPKKTTTAFEILKSKAADAAGHVKQRFKIGLPTRTKLSQSEGNKLRRRPRKKVAASEELDQEVPDEDMEEREGETAGELETGEQEQQLHSESVGMEEEIVEEASPPPPTEESKKEAQRKEKEAQAEEKLRKQKEQEEIKRQKAEEKQQAKEEAQRKKAEEKLAKQKAADEAKKAAEEAKRVKLEEQLAKAREAQEQKRLKEEEELRKIREQEAAKAVEQEAKAREQEAAKALEQEAKAREKEAKAREQEQAKAREQEEAKAREQEEGKIREQEVTPLEQEAPVQSEASPTEESTEAQEEQHEPEQVSTPTGTGKRKVKKMTFPQMPHLPQMPTLPSMPHIDLDFRKKIKRSKTPPARPEPPKSKFGRRGGNETENQLATQYASELSAREAEMEEESNQGNLREPQIYVTQPSSDTVDEGQTHVEWEPTASTPAPSAEEFEETQEEGPSTSKKPAPAKERLDKFGKSLMGFGTKSKEVASQKSKAMGEKMKVIGKDLQKFGVKVNEKYQSTIEEIKSKQEAAKARSKQKAKEAEDIETEENFEDFEEEYQGESSTEPRRTFRFRRRDESQEESEEAEPKPPSYYENSEDVRTRNEAEAKDESRRTRSQLLGRADRDWESPLDLAHSRDVSEEPGNLSSRDSPPGSSMASSTFAHVRKQGVLEEIDSDEFFLREKGISEGEDEEEINRFLVEELRQAFRPQVSNALAGFDLPESPDRPERLPRKPPRKEKEDKSSSYQTFPPERPRRKAPGYVSAYMNQQQEDQEFDQDQDSQVEERGSPQDDLAEYDEDGMRILKEDIEFLNQELEEGGTGEGYEDDGRYEPVNEEPVKPTRTKKRQQKSTTPVYYNTVAGNEWMRDLEDQVEPVPDETSSPKPPQRERRKSSRSENQFEVTEAHGAREMTQEEEVAAAEAAFLQEDSQQPTGAESETQLNASEVDVDDGFEYVDEAGYAVVHKDRDVPRTAPRRKRKSGSKSGSLKRSSPEQSQQEQDTAGNDPTFFSLPRSNPRSSNVAPPSRPQRNYSTLMPRRPPRNKGSPSGSQKGKAGDSGKGDSTRPSTAIGIMQGRPLPPPPRPERSPVPMNDLDQTSIERAVGARHYANFDGQGEPGQVEVVEELFTATNIPVLGRRTESTLQQAGTSSTLDSDINVGIQTDPFHEEIAATRSFLQDSSRVQRQRYVSF